MKKTQLSPPKGDAPHSLGTAVLEDVIPASVVSTLQKGNITNEISVEQVQILGC